ncbi:MAG TPA: VOC family protein [Bryobacteraceae bacterium]|nr:VOC family protein [Bryobacteraceae bacterium]
MPKIERHLPGDFCWFELGTTNQASAKPFYAAVLGWSAVDFPMGPDSFYTMFQLDGADAAAAYAMRPEEAALIPPHWNPYVAVEDAGETARCAAELGGKVVEAPFDVNTFGRVAVLRDPTGAYFNIWQPRDHSGAGIVGEPGAFCWAELATRDPSGAVRFYEQLFGWKTGPVDGFPPDYPVIRREERNIGGVRCETALPPHWLLFFVTADIDTAVASAKQYGGTIHVGPIPMGVSRYAALADPQGAVFSLVQPPTEGVIA